MPGPIEQGELIYRVRIEGEAEAEAKLQRVLNAGVGTRNVGGGAGAGSSAGSGAGSAASFGGGYASQAIPAGGFSSAGSAASFGGATPNIPALPNVEIGRDLGPGLNNLAGAVSSGMTQYDRNQTAVANQMSQVVSTQAGSVRQIAQITNNMTGQGGAIVQFTKALETDRRERDVQTRQSTREAARIIDLASEQSTRRVQAEARQAQITEFPRVGAFAEVVPLAATGTEGAPGRAYNRAFRSDGPGRQNVRGFASGATGSGGSRGRRFTPAGPPPPPGGGGGGGGGGDDDGERPADQFNVIDMESRRKQRTARFSRREESNARALELQKAEAQKLDAQIVRAEVQERNAETARINSETSRATATLRERLQPTVERARENRARATGVRAETGLQAAMRQVDAERRRRSDEDLRQELQPQRQLSQRLRSNAQVVNAETQVQAAERRTLAERRRSVEERGKLNRLDQDEETRALRSKSTNIQQRIRLTKAQEQAEAEPARQRERGIQRVIKDITDFHISANDRIIEARDRILRRKDKIDTIGQRADEKLDRETERALRDAQRTAARAEKTNIEALAGQVAAPLSVEEQASRRAASNMRARGMTPDAINEALRSQGLPPIMRTPGGGEGGEVPWGQRPWGGIGGRLDLAANVAGWGSLIGSAVGMYAVQGKQIGTDIGIPNFGLTGLADMAGIDPSMYKDIPVIGGLLTGSLRTTGVQEKRLDTDYLRGLSEINTREQERERQEAWALLDLDRSRKLTERGYAIESGQAANQYFRTMDQISSQESDVARGISNVMTTFTRSMEDFGNTITQIQTGFTRAQEQFADARSDMARQEERFATAQTLRTQYREEDYQRGLAGVERSRGRMQYDVDRQFEEFGENRRRFGEEEEWRRSDFNRDLGRIQRANQERQEDTRRVREEREKSIREGREDMPLESASAAFGLIGSMESGDLGTMLNGILSWRRFQRGRQEFEENAARGGFTEQELVNIQRSETAGQEAEADFIEAGRRTDIRAGYTLADMEKQEAEMIENIRRFNEDLLLTVENLDIQVIRDRNAQAMEEMYQAQDVLTARARLSRAEIQAAADVITATDQATLAMTRNIQDTQTTLADSANALIKLEEQRQLLISDFENAQAIRREGVQNQLNEIIKKETEIYTLRENAQTQHQKDLDNALLMYERQKEDLALAREAANFQLMMGLGFAALFAPWAELAAVMGGGKAAGGLPLLARPPGSPKGGAPTPAPGTKATAMIPPGATNPVGVMAALQSGDLIGAASIAIFGTGASPEQRAAFVAERYAEQGFSSLRDRIYNYVLGGGDVGALSESLTRGRADGGETGGAMALADQLRLSGYARGGIINRPTILSDMGGRAYGIMAEKGPEAIVPMSRGGGLAPTFIFYIQPGYGDPRAVIREAVETAKREFDLEMEQASIQVWGGAA